MSGEGGSADCTSMEAAVVQGMSGRSGSADCASTEGIVVVRDKGIVNSDEGLGRDGLDGFVTPASEGAGETSDKVRGDIIGVDVGAERVGIIVSRITPCRTMERFARSCSSGAIHSKARGLLGTP